MLKRVREKDAKRKAAIIEEDQRPTKLRCEREERIAVVQLKSLLGMLPPFQSSEPELAMHMLMKPQKMNSLRTTGKTLGATLNRDQVADQIKNSSLQKPSIALSGNRKRLVYKEAATKIEEEGMRNWI